jgi:predicted flap endonuclease-1-like 5' DNA nuclease
MAILWLIIGFLIGVAVAWYYFDARIKMQPGAGETDVSRRIGAGETAIASSQDSARLAELQDQVRQRDGEISRLEAELAECRSKAAGTASALATGDGAGTAPADAASPPASGAADDLTKIKGIGQVLQGKLNQQGITTFRQIADFTEADIERVDAVLDFPGRIERERWVEQARDFVR